MGKSQKKYSLGNNLRFARKKTRVTQQQLCDAIGLNRSAYAYYETGKSDPKIDTLRKLAYAFRVSCDELVFYFGYKAKTVGSPDNEVDLAEVEDRLTQLSLDEKTLLLRARLLSDEQREELDSIIKNMMD